MAVLPQIDIHAFLQGKEARDACERMFRDPRLRRCRFEVMDGDIDTALTHYKTHKCPRIILLEIGDAPQNLAEKLDQLENYGGTEAHFIILGQVNDVKIYRELSDMGVDDYLVPPFFSDELIESFQKSIVKDDDRLMNRNLILSLGAKGGVGATSVAQMTAAALGMGNGYGAILLDLCGPTGTSGISYGCDSKMSIGEMLADINALDIAKLQKLGHEIGEKLLIYPAGKGEPLSNISLGAFEMLLEKFFEICPNIVVDVPTGYSEQAEILVNQADHILLVTTPTVSAVRNSFTILRSIDTLPVTTLINKIGESPKYELSAQEVCNLLEIDSNLSLPFLPDLFLGAEIKGKGLTYDSKHQNALKDLINWARNLGTDETKKKKKKRSGQKKAAGAWLKKWV